MTGGHLLARMVAGESFHRAASSSVVRRMDRLFVGWGPFMLGCFSPSSQYSCDVTRIRLQKHRASLCEPRFRILARSPFHCRSVKHSRREAPVCERQSRSHFSIVRQSGIAAPPPSGRVPQHQVASLRHYWTLANAGIRLGAPHRARRIRVTPRSASRFHGFMSLGFRRRIRARLAPSTALCVKRHQNAVPGSSRGGGLPRLLEVRLYFIAVLPAICFHRHSSKSHTFLRIKMRSNPCSTSLLRSLDLAR